MGSVCGGRSARRHRVCERVAQAGGHAILIALLSGTASAQFLTKLDARTVEEFDRYTKRVETRPFPAIDEGRVLRGELVVEPGAEPNPTQIPNGLIHDWVGAVFIPNVGMQRVLDVLQGFDQHARVYPGVVRSRLLRRNGNDLAGYWRLQWRDPLLTVVLDVKQQAHYKQVAPGQWTCRAYAHDISEVQHPGTAQEKELPPGEGHGFLWRLNAYWSLETVGGGVLAECRTVSLSRDVPTVLAWAINPFVQKLPRESLVSTLEHTREAAGK